MKTVLFVPDAHVTPNQDLSRFAALSQLIVDRKPDCIIDLGDFVSFESLSHWDQNKRLTMEGRRYHADIVAANAAYDLMFNDLDTLQAKQRKNKEKVYNPVKVKFDGNHEEWANKYTEQHPEMAGFMDIGRDLRLAERGFIHFPYRTVAEMDGISVCHIPMAQNNQPIGGKYVTSKAWDRFTGPVIFAHTHRFQLFGNKRVDGSQTTEAMSIGCFIEGTPPYAQGADPGWWSGVTLLYIYGEEGEFDFERISLTRLRDQYPV